MSVQEAAFPEQPVQLAELEDEVLAWRQEQFRQLGFSDHEATGLAGSDADLGQARYLVGCGCAPQLALRILR